MANGGILPLILLLELSSGSYGLQHIVGDSIWSIPPTNDFYTNWSSSNSFHIGDTLYFDFDSGLYDVIQVSRGEFDSCTGNQAFKAFMDGPAIFALSRKGVFYFICNVSNYCDLGQKVSVIVDHQNYSMDSSGPSPSPLPDFRPQTPPATSPFSSQSPDHGTIRE
ncbi:hypothetical protein DH2020_028498 [Rehmannia glutinosa]|uniref:Phytocyanin domain-containing protein n=1 Tax=Rehmannia glutinosa TaxID=99300 RepID=A0ABR0VTX3_REHGL